MYGANSSGKSSVVHALALAHDAVQTGEVDTSRTAIGGDSIDLGGFAQYVHLRDRSRLVELTFEVGPTRFLGRLGDFLPEIPSAVVEVGIGASVERGGRKDDEASEEQEPPRVNVERLALEVDGRPLLTMSARGDGRLQLDRLDHTQRPFRDLLGSMLALVTTAQEIREEDFGELSEVLDDLVPVIRSERFGLIPRVIPRLRGEGPEPGMEFVNVRRAHRQEDLAVAARMHLPRLLSDLVRSLSLAVDEDLNRLLYLGPLRSFPPRHLAFSQEQDGNWFAGGGYTWDVVRADGRVREVVNGWLGDAERLQTPYELRVRELLPADAITTELRPRAAQMLQELAFQILTGQAADDVPADLAAASAAMREWIGNGAEPKHRPRVEIESLVDTLGDVEAATRRWMKEVGAASGEGLEDVVLIDKRSGTEVSHRDIGIGVSQVLPVLVAAFAYREKLIAIEQPEIHLHPALQAELGDLFIRSALGGAANSFLIETHSEHLLLRIMRRMRETVADDLPAGVPPVRPEDVAVLFIEPDGGHSLVREMPLNERGELVKAWPGGFFEESMREIF